MLHKNGGIEGIQEILDILDNAKDERGGVPMRLVRKAFDKLVQSEERTEKCTETHACDSLSRQDAIDALKICDNNEDGINCYKCPIRDERWDGPWKDDETSCYRKLMRDSAELLSSQPEQKWIPCSERLPEDYNDVLITYTHSFELTCPQETAKLLKGVKTVSGNPIDPKVLWEVPFADYIAFYDVDEKRWNSPTDNPEPFPDEIKVIAWMPLPEPYRPEGEEHG